MKTVLICHEGAAISEEGLARWLASFSQLQGMVVIREPRGLFWRRVRAEARRVGWVRLLDVFAFRVYYRIALAAADRRWEADALTRLTDRYPALPADLPALITPDPNSAETADFIAALAPDLMIARCKVLLKERIFAIPLHGTFVMHPGICPEYRNSHGCFWALARDDLDRVGMTLLQIDRGIDTGPVYGYYTAPYDEVTESHIVIQGRVVLDNLDAIAARLGEIAAGRADPLDTSGRDSRVWGQPWLSAYLRWKRHARRRAGSRSV